MKEEIAESPQALPPEIATSIQSALQKLPHPFPYLNLTTSSLQEGLQRWQNNPVENSLLILTSPVENCHSLFNEVLENNSPDLPILYIAKERPEDYKEIPHLLASVIEKDNDTPRLIVIPNLTNCFLRCMGGLEGIIYLRDLVVRDSSDFWLIGCNTWAWQYLDYICHIHACFEQNVVLPELNENEITEWLQPAMEAVQVCIDADTTNLSNLTQNALGIPSVAAQLWAKSLSFEENQLIFSSPSLPPLPELSSRDRYLLYSLLLHTSLTLPQLAISLGENESLIRSYIKELCLKKLLQGDTNHLQINPLYYPQLRLELAQNNFLVAF